MTSLHHNQAQAAPRRNLLQPPARFPFSRPSTLTLGSGPRTIKLTGLKFREVLMDSGIIGKIEKARRYAEEKERVTFTSFKATFQGNHNTYDVGFDSGAWQCGCHFFATRGVCSHTMALQRILEDMLAREHHATEAL